MITVIAIAEAGESHIRRYDTDDVRDARDHFVQDWIDGKIVWEWWEYHGPNCTVDNPAFTPEFLRQHGFEDEPAPEETEGVTIYTWWCITGIHGSDEHFVTGYTVTGTLAGKARALNEKKGPGTVSQVPAAKG